MEVCLKIFADIAKFRSNWYEYTGNVWSMSEDDIYEAGIKLKVTRVITEKSD